MLNYHDFRRKELTRLREERMNKLLEENKADFAKRKQLFEEDEQEFVKLYDEEKASLLEKHKKEKIELENSPLE